MQRSMHSLYTATMETADYLVSIQDQHREFQTEIMQKHDELKQSNEELLDFQERHKESIERVESMTSDIQWRQSDIAEQQTQFQVKQDLFQETVTDIDHRQKEVLRNQYQIEHQMDSLNDKQSVLKEHIAESIEVQKESMEHQHRIFDEQQELQKDIKRNHVQINEFWADSSHQQQAILEKQDDALDSMTEIEQKTNALREETAAMEQEMGKLFESQWKEILSAKQEIRELTEETANAHHQIMDVVDELLFWVQAIYRMDFHLLQQFVSVQSCLFYMLWSITSFIVTIPEPVRSARKWMFCSLILCVLIETNLMSRLLANWSPEQVVLESDHFLVNDEWRRCLRNVTLTLNIVVYTYSFSIFTDPKQEQLKLLKRIDSKVRRAPRVRTSSITFASALSSITPKNIWRRFKK